MASPHAGHGIVATTSGVSPFARATVNFSSSGDNTVVSSVANQTIRVFRVLLVVGAATNITFKDGGGASFTGPLPMSANGGITLDYQDLAWYTTAAGTSFVINSSNAVQVSGSVEYQQS